VSLAAAFIVVGGAMLAPSLLDSSVSLLNADGTPGSGVGSGLIVNQAQVAAVATLKGNVAGTSDTGMMSDDNPQTSARFIDCMKQLGALRGFYGAHAGLAKVTIDDALQVLTAFLDACRAGVQSTVADAVNDEQGYAVGIGFGGEQSDGIFQRLLANEELDDAQLTPLGFAVRACVREKIKCGISQVGTTSDDAIYTAAFGEDAMLSVGVLCVRMDSAGIRNPPGAEDALSFAENVATFAPRLGTRLQEVTSHAVTAIGGAAAGVIADSVGAVVFSTPVMLGLAALLVWKTVTK
jgi:hypothetical protein